MITIITHGHSPKGKDPGAVAKTGQTEAKTNQNVAVKLVELRKAAGDTVYYLNEVGKDITPSEKVMMAQKYNYDVWVEVHHNKDAKDTANGAEVLYDFRNPKAKILAECIDKRFREINNSRGIKTEVSTINPKKNAVGVLNAKSGANVVTEFEFLSITGTQEIDTLTEQWAEAEAISKGISDYYKELKK